MRSVTVKYGSTRALIWVLPEFRVYHKELEGTKENGLPPHEVDFQCDLMK
jgi:hypothetical protein